MFSRILRVAVDSNWRNTVYISLVYSRTVCHSMVYHSSYTFLQKGSSRSWLHACCFPHSAFLFSKASISFQILLKKRLLFPAVNTLLNEGELFI
ncbi:hypothetical protein XELAEV_18033463mg [Xenopus laevis]|uniref:Uncharacterized protein n=1 Tax=Xenopus laevis TaxID=8355 RepID=A0A974CJA4_XENLA|nr:hypothetical protein XELAEV_18033463mg [Xenopus laevis]